MTGDLVGRVVLVTGGSRGIGLEVVSALCRLGMIVLLGDRDPWAWQRSGWRSALCGRGRAGGGLDVTDPVIISRAATWIDEQFGRLNVLVNNAGIAGDRDAQVAEQTDVDVVREGFATNVFGVITVTEEMLPLLRRSEHGRIVNVSSSVGSVTRMGDPQHYFARLPGSPAYPPSTSARSTRSPCSTPRRSSRRGSWSTPPTLATAPPTSRRESPV